MVVDQDQLSKMQKPVLKQQIGGLNCNSSNKSLTKAVLTGVMSKDVSTLHANVLGHPQEVEGQHQHPHLQVETHLKHV
jgi:hypothetical protein